MVSSRILVAVALYLGFVVITHAHHSLPALFDTSSNVVVVGEVTLFEFKAPHSYVHIKVAGDTGVDITWELETYPPGMLVRQGMTPDVLPPGLKVSATGYPARDGRPLMRLLTLTLPDGTVRQVQAP